MHLQAPGFWGPPTSTVDWCEANYAHSGYVAELFNTVSSLSMLAAGAVGIALHRGFVERRFLLAFFAVAVVGVGSVAFHATLRFELQMLDELPMLYLALIMAFILIEDRPERRFGPWFPALLVAHAALVTALSAFTRGTLQFVSFHLSFGSIEFFALYRVYRISRRNRSPVVRRLFRAGMGAYAVALVCWFVDLRFCPIFSVELPRLGLPNPELHAVWHVLVSAGFYLLVVLVALDRLEMLGKAPRLSRAAGFVPRLELGVSAPRG